MRAQRTGTLRFPRGHRINETRQQEVADHQAQRQHHLQVIGRMPRVAVVPRVACVEGFMVDPSEKRENMAEQTVQPIGLENRAVAHFVNAVDQECRHHPVRKNQGRRRQPRPVPE